jgi:hypothetical protein
MLWHAFMFLGLSFFLFSSFGFVAYDAFSCEHLLNFEVFLRPKRKNE